MIVGAHNPDDVAGFDQSVGVRHDDGIALLLQAQHDAVPFVLELPVLQGLSGKGLLTGQLDGAYGQSVLHNRIIAFHELLQGPRVLCRLDADQTVEVLDGLQIADDVKLIPCVNDGFRARQDHMLAVMADLYHVDVEDPSPLQVRQAFFQKVRVVRGDQSDDMQLFVQPGLPLSLGFLRFDDALVQVAQKLGFQPQV